MEDVYVDQPLGYEKEGRDNVYKLRKTLYALGRLQGPGIARLKPILIKRILKNALMNIHCL